MTFAFDKLAVNAKGGTEIMKEGLGERIDPDLLKHFQIFVSRVQEDMDETKIRIYWLQDLPGDPAADHLKNGGWNKFHKLVFATNWQMQGFINMYNIPWSKCIVLPNCITPLPEHEKPRDKMRLAYWSTPHRGLNILIPVFEKLRERFPDIELDVYSSFKLYGWAERDKQFEDLFEKCRQTEGINYHGSIPNQDLRKALEQTHILAYPSIWQETSCITLMEAMSGGLACVHPNYGALYETAAGWTQMYQWSENLQDHATAFYHILAGTIENYWEPTIQARIASQMTYANVFYNWDLRIHLWDALLRSLVDLPRDLPKTNPGQKFFEYKALR
jgi:UDP-glucose:(glucosyl)LPS alpha-1,2-glucosyltransferase